VKRLLVLGVTAWLLATGTVAAPAGIAATDRGETCAKIRHSKIVWVKVKRHGKMVRVKRKKVWWTCDPYEAPGPPRLKVVAQEFKLTFSRPYIKAGKLILQLDNQGEDSHNLRIGPAHGGPAFAKVGNTESGRQKTVNVPLKPGTYRLWCALPQHAKLGMKATLRVVPADH
jgi:hypothetical protein